MDVFQPDTLASLETLAGAFDAHEETRIVLKPIIEPIIFRFEFMRTTAPYGDEKVVTRILIHISCSLVAG